MFYVYSRLFDSEDEMDTQDRDRRTSRRRRATQNYFEGSDTDESDVDFDLSDDEDPDFILSQDDTAPEQHNLSDSSDFDSDDDIPLATAFAAEIAENRVNAESTITWGKVKSEHFDKSFSYTGEESIPLESTLLSKYSIEDITPLTVYESLVDESIINLLVTETNRNADEFLEKIKEVCKNTNRNVPQRYKEWQTLDSSDIKKFIGLVMYMGIVNEPQMNLYWSTDPLYRNEFVVSVMSRNKFHNILKFLHFQNRHTEEPTDRLTKVRTLLTTLEKNFIAAKIPGEKIVVDESMVAWRGRLLWHQYNPGKAHKYGMKLYKLCDPESYVYTSSPYTGKGDAHRDRGRPTETSSHSTQIVLDLAEPFLGEGRTVIVDNFYSSPRLGAELLSKQTHIVGTLRKRRKNVPREVEGAKLKRGKMFGLQDPKTGIVVMKWKDKRDVMMLSSKHGLSQSSVGQNKRTKEEIMKPDSIIEYNSAKQGIDLSDQMTSYYDPLRKTVRWYHKLAFSFLLGIAVSNARLLYNAIRTKKMAILQFRQILIRSLVNPPLTRTPSRSRRYHNLVETSEFDSRGHRQRRRCAAPIGGPCYELLQKSSKGLENVRVKRANVNIKTIWRCMNCDGNPYICPACFGWYHNNKMS